MLENFKRKIQGRIERNAVKSELTWYSKELVKKDNGEWERDENGKRVRIKIPHTEIVLLKRSRIPIVGDWGRIYPPIDENGKINWINLIFGGWKNLVKLLFFMVIVGMVLWQFNEIFNYVAYIKDLPCVQSCFEQIKGMPSIIPFR